MASKQKSYYASGEEEFGSIGAWLYSFFSKLKNASELYEFIAQDVLAENPESVLDVGTGPAIAPRTIATCDKAVGVYGIDPSPYMVKLAKKNNAALGNVHIALGSSRHVPFKRKFDVISSSLSFHHWNGKTNSLLYLSKFLSKRGKIYIYEVNKDKLCVIQQRLFIGSHAISPAEVRSYAHGLVFAGYKSKGNYMRVAFMRQATIMRSHK